MINPFLLKLIEKRYDDLTISELNIIAKYKNVFGMNNSFIKMIPTDNDSKLLKDLKNNEKIKNELTEHLNRIFYILEQLNLFKINESNIIIDYEKDLFDVLNKMSMDKICKFTDRLGYYMDDYKLYFFGYKETENSYHRLNKVISNAYGVDLVFDIFGRKNSKKYNLIDINKISKEDFIKTLCDISIHYRYVLIEIASVILEADDELMNSQKRLSILITKSIKIYRTIIEEEKKITKKVKIGPEQEGIYSSDNIGTKITN